MSAPDRTPGNQGKCFLLHAPGVHAGGGLILLKSVLNSFCGSVVHANLDARLSDNMFLSTVRVAPIKPTLISRLWAEVCLYRISRDDYVILCFSNLPPLFRVRGRVVVFLQNRLLLTGDSLRSHRWSTRLRITVERFWLKLFAGHVDRFIVQTPSMARDARLFLGGKVALSVQPFMGLKFCCVAGQTDRKFDFIYVAGDEAHKNHANLLEAWILLAESGYFPSLALTLPPPGEVWAAIEKRIRFDSLNICNLGILTTDEVYGLYASASALIYPSYSESLGLPLIEATNMGIPILAPELDYVRDIVEPAHTFDPFSPVSIARAVRRFMNCAEPLTAIGTPEDFLAEVFR